MEREAAEREAARLNNEHPDRVRYRWFARESDGDWTIARAAGLGRSPSELKPTSEPGPSSPHPAPPSEPRPEWGF